MNRTELGKPISYSKLQYNNAIELLKSLDPKNFQENDYNSPVIENKKFDEKYQGQCVKQPRYKNCSFYGTHFDGINGISSSILKCYFEKVQFKDAGMAYSDLSGSEFSLGSTIYNCGFTKCNFTKTLFSVFTAEASVFDESYFIDSKIRNSNFIHCSFDNAVFTNTSFNNCDLIHCDFEYASFNNAKFDNVILPFWGVLKSFNLLKEINTQKNNNIRIKYSNTSKELSVQQLIDYFETLQPYFIKKGEYFVLANINIFLGNQEKALYALLMGIDQAIKNVDFRVVRYLCKLASKNILFSRENLKDLYEAIVNNSYISEMNNHEYMLYSEQIREIKNLLIDNPFYAPQVSITFKTSILPDDYISQARLVEFIEKEIHSKLPNYHFYYNVRHNSPPIYEFLLNGSLLDIYNFVLCISAICFGFSKTVKALKEILEVHKIVLENKYYESVLNEKIKGIYLDNAIKEEDLKRKKAENFSNKKECSRTQQHNTVDTITDKINSIKTTTYTPDSEDLPIREFTTTRDNDEQDNN